MKYRLFQLNKDGPKFCWASTKHAHTYTFILQHNITHKTGTHTQKSSEHLPFARFLFPPLQCKAHLPLHLLMPPGLSCSLSFPHSLFTSLSLFLCRSVYRFGLQLSVLVLRYFCVAFYSLYCWLLGSPRSETQRLFDIVCCSRSSSSLVPSFPILDIYIWICMCIYRYVFFYYAVI